MKLVMLQSNLSKALNQVSRVVGTRSTLPVLSNILISAKQGKIVFSATDLEIGVATQVVGKIEEEGELTVPARLLTDFIVNNNDETIELSTVETKMSLKSAKFEAHIAGISAEEFPTIPESPKDIFCTLTKNVFVDAIKKVIIAPAVDETRPTLAGIYFQFKGKQLILAATDSYRLAEKKLELSTDISERKMIVPTRTMAEVLRLLSAADNAADISMASTENQIFFIIEDTHVVSRLIEGAFPNYTQIIPSSHKITTTTDYKELVAGLKMAALFAKNAANNIRLKTGADEIVISSALTQTGDATSRMKAEIKGKDEIEIAFNARYLIDALNVASGNKVALKLNDNATAGVMEFDSDKDFLYIIMPLKTEN